MACGILVPRPGMEPMPPALEAQGFNHWTAREVPRALTFLLGWPKGLFGFFRIILQKNPNECFGQPQ